MRTFSMSKLLFCTGLGLGLIVMPTLALAAPVKLAATLAGAGEESGGDPDGAGTFSVDADAALGDFCYTLNLTKVGKVTGAHVQLNAVEPDPQPLIKLDVTGASSDECIAVEPKVLEPIVANPGSYYISVHTADFPKGAVRGTLSRK